MTKCPKTKIPKEGGISKSETNFREAGRSPKWRSSIRVSSFDDLRPKLGSVAGGCALPENRKLHNQNFAGMFEKYKYGEAGRRA